VSVIVMLTSVSIRVAVSSSTRLTYLARSRS